MSEIVTNENTSFAPFLEGLVAFANLDDPSRLVALDALNYGEMFVHDPDAELPSNILQNLRSSLAAGDAVTKIARLSPSARNKIYEAHLASFKKSTSWFVDEAFSLQNCMIAQSYQMTLDGHENLRSRVVAESLERLGRKVNNASWVIRHFASKTPSLVEIVEDPSGRKSLTYKLTDAGIQEGKLLLDLASKAVAPKAKTKS